MAVATGHPDYSMFLSATLVPSSSPLNHLDQGCGELGWGGS